MNSPNAQNILLNTKRHTLLVMLICYIPHFATAPWWLFLLVLAAILYRLIADYFGSPLLSKWVRLLLVICCLFLLKMHYGSIISSGFFIGFLLTFIALKTIEIHSMRDIKVLVLCNFYLIFSALIVIQELWIIVYLIIALLANLSLMLKLAAPQASLRQIGGKSIKQLLIAIPLTIILFYVFPRIANPLWQVPSSNMNHTGFSERMNPGSIADLFSDDSIALRVTFNKNPILNGYWEGLILSFYNGVSWNPGGYFAQDFPPLNALTSDDEADYQVILEPHDKKWLFFLGHPVASRPELLYSLNYGLVSQTKDVISQRFAYALKVQPVPYQALNLREMQQYTQLPRTLNLQLQRWANEQFQLSNNDPRAFILFLQRYLNEHSFWYTLSPPVLDSNKNQMDYFWFNTQKGFCEHYASAVTVILRSVGIPARIIVGYQGGEWNPVAQYLTIKQSDAHAWLEYWQEGTGWTTFDPTAYIAPERIDQSIKDKQESMLNQSDYSDTSSMSWFQRSKLFLESARFFAERWLLFYNQDAQRDLLERMGLKQWDVGRLLQITVISLVLFIVLLALCYQWMQRRAKDALTEEYHLLQKEFKRFNVEITPATTLNQQCDALRDKAPALSSCISLFVHHYETLRLKQSPPPRDTKKETIRLFKGLRRKLNKYKIN